MSYHYNIWPEILQFYYEEQQNGINTDCSFEFNISTENGTRKKIIHGHKKFLCLVSEYFNAHMKWSGNQTILIKECEYSVFQKLIKAIYLGEVTFEDLKEACELYEVADFYCIEETFNFLREEIMRYWKENKTIEISSLVNLSFKYDDAKLKHFISKVFAHNAQKIIQDPDFLKYPLEAINYFYQLDDLIADECDLMKALEKYLLKTEINMEKLSPAIDTIRFVSLTEDQINATCLLSNYVKDLVKENRTSQNKKPRKQKPFFLFLSPETQSKFIIKSSQTNCWICEQTNYEHQCFADFYTTESNSVDDTINSETNMMIRRNYEDYSREDIIKILRDFQKTDENFKYPSYIDDEIDRIYFI